MLKPRSFLNHKIYEYKRFSIVVNGKNYTYCPDLYFPDKDFYYEIKGHAKSASNWQCTCETCKKNKQKIKNTIARYVIKIRLIGSKEYKKMKKRFKKRIPKWEE